MSPDKQWEQEQERNRNDYQEQQQEQINLENIRQMEEMEKEQLQQRMRDAMYAYNETEQQSLEENEAALNEYLTQQYEENKQQYFQIEQAILNEYVSEDDLQTKNIREEIDKISTNKELEKQEKISQEQVNKYDKQLWMLILANAINKRFPNDKKLKEYEIKNQQDLDAQANDVVQKLKINYKTLNIIQEKQKQQLAQTILPKLQETVVNENPEIKQQNNTV